MKTYPIALVGLEKQKTVVIGGGKTAFRKVKALLQAGAKVTVISPSLCDEVTRLQRQGTITVEERAYAPGDLKGAFLVIAATDLWTVNQAVLQEALTEKCLVNLVDNPQESGFITPAVVQRGEISLSISTGGTSPILSRCLRQLLEAWACSELSEVAVLFGELRPQIAAWLEADPSRFATIQRLVTEDLPEVIRLRGRDAAREFLENQLAISTGNGDREHV